MATKKKKASGQRVECAFDKMVPIEEIIPNPRNPNKHPKKQLELLSKIIKAQGWRNPIVVSNLSGFVTKGHARLEAAKLLGLAEVPVDFQDYDTPESEMADMLADNRLAELAEPDLPLLKDILTELDTGAFDMDLTGFDTESIESLMTQLHQPEDGLTEDDTIPEQVETRCKKGDLWILGEHRLLCGDSTVITDVERLMGGVLADCVWTDPPYGVDYEGKTKKKLKLENDAIGDMYTWLLSVFGLISTFMVDGAAFYVCCPPGNIHRAFQNALEDSDLPVRQGLVWLKDSMVLGHSDYHYKHEPILYGWKGNSHYFTEDRTQVSVFDIPRPKRSESHPTMKPVLLIECMLKNSSKVGQVVLDAFGGSGSTLIACEKLGRKCYGMEISETYVAVAVQRWMNFTGKQAILEETGETFDQVKQRRGVSDAIK